MPDEDNYADAHSEATPELFHVDEAVGADMPALEDQLETPKKSKSKNTLVKKNLNQGLSYLSEKSGKFVLGRRFQNKPRCNDKSGHKSLACRQISDDAIKSMKADFYDIGKLDIQREFIARHVSYSSKSQRKRRIQYSLPDPDNPGHTFSVCKTMFLHALSISERQVRTVLQKKESPTGVLGKERRGGVQRWDPGKRNAVLEHLNKFPRVESHYCRLNSKFQYVSGELTKRRMYRMFERERPQYASYSLYKLVMREHRLKIHRPKRQMWVL